MTPDHYIPTELDLGTAFRVLGYMARGLVYNQSPSNATAMRMFLAIGGVQDLLRAYATTHDMPHAEARALVDGEEDS
jgi:hypothetical protein